tara:strand:+ start:7944 stop:9218 length:1275 start_codon:yes stop_codon:yes gene_type:complete
MRLGASKYLILLAFCSAIALTYYVLSPQLVQFGLNVEKYTEINIPKNTGFQRSMLIALNRMTFLFPRNDKTDIDYAALLAQLDYPLTPYPQPSRKVYVENTAELIQALASDLSDLEVTLMPGEYRLEEKKYTLKKSTDSLSVIRADKPETVTIQLKSREGLVLQTPNWVIENLKIQGVCDFDSRCDHALHIVGNADNISIQNNRFVNFNAHIKSNGFIPKQTMKREFPDNIKILRNHFINEWQRDTRLPVTPLDVVGGNDWLIAGNFIADFSKSGGNRVTYGAFLKGGGENGVFERNFIACEWRVPHDGALDTRVGLSFGGGGTGKSLCQSDNCEYEHKAGIMRDNTVVNCKNDVSVYINKATDIAITNNYLLNSVGIDVRFPQSDVVVTSNILDGRIKARDSGKVSSFNNTLLHPLWGSTHDR